MSTLPTILSLAAALSLVQATRRFAGSGGDRLGRDVRRSASAARRTAEAALEALAVRAAWPGGVRALAAVAALGPLAAGCAAGVVAGPPLGAGVWALGVVGVVVAARLRARRRLEAVAAHVPDLCERLAAAVRAGRSLRAALERAAAEAPEPAREELRALAGELALGAPVEAALANAAIRLPTPELGAVAATIEVQRRAGGSLVRALEDLAGRLRGRRRLAAELRAATAQARATAWIVAAIPVVGGLAVEASAPGTLGHILGSGAGLAIAASSGALYAVAIASVLRISRVAT